MNKIKQFTNLIVQMTFILQLFVLFQGHAKQINLGLVQTWLP